MTATSPATLADRIEALASTPAGEPLPGDAEATVDQLLAALESGTVRAAERGDDGAWRAVPWVKRGILLGFRVGRCRRVVGANAGDREVP